MSVVGISVEVSAETVRRRGVFEGVCLEGIRPAVCVDAAAAVWATIWLITSGFAIGYIGCPSMEQAAKKINSKRKYFFIA